VAIIDRDAEGNPCYRAINSCLVPLPLLAGRENRDGRKASPPPARCLQSESEEDGADVHGSQCGYWHSPVSFFPSVEAITARTFA